MNANQQKTNVEKVTDFMEFGNPMKQVFVIEAISRYAKEVQNNRVTLKTQMKDSLIHPDAWIACADEWVKQNP